MIKTPNGPTWLTVPVNYHKTSQLICDTLIDGSQSWKKAHLNRFKANYGKAPFCADAFRILETGIREDTISTISQLNIRLIKLICAYLGISTPLKMSQEYAVAGTKTERLIQLLKESGATVYLSGPAARDYLEEDQFRENGIRLEYKTYDYLPYQQLWGDFVGNVSVLDLIANVGPDARRYLNSQTPNQLAVA
jgi:hypothetical protein